jgi:hypothetical protein
MLEKILNYLHTSTDSLLSSFFIGYALKTVCLMLVNTLLAFVLLSPVSAIPYLNLYFLYLTMMLPKAKKSVTENKFKILSIIPHLFKKLFNVKNKVSSFINSTFTSVLATVLMVYLQGSFLLAAPTFAGLFLTYLVISSYCGSEIADTLFDIRVIAISVLAGFAMTMLSGLTHHIFLGAYTIITIAGYIHLNEASGAHSKYNLDSILMLLLALISPITAACRYIGFMLPVIAVMESSIAKVIHTCSSALLIGHTTKAAFDSPATMNEHDVSKQNTGREDANPRGLKAQAA